MTITNGATGANAVDTTHAVTQIIGSIELYPATLANNLVQLKEGQDTLVNVYVYYEGSDTNIQTKNLQENKLDESQSVKINFTATADNQN